MPRSTETKLSTDEEIAVEAILDVMRAIENLYGGKMPYNWQNEGIPAVHTLQHFVMQHWAHRVNPEQWADWTMDIPATDRRQPDRRRPK